MNLNCDKKENDTKMTKISNVLYCLHVLTSMFLLVGLEWNHGQLICNYTLIYLNLL